MGFHFVQMVTADIDTPNNPNRIRLHSDNSLQIRYFNNKPDNFLSKSCFFINPAILVFESGGGVSAFGNSTEPAQKFHERYVFIIDYGLQMIKIGWTMGGGFMHNPGRYLVLLPTGAASTTFTQNPGDKFDAWDVSTTIQYMPNENTTWFAELVHREANIPYFAGHGGVTSPNGYNAPIGDPTNFFPDLVKHETRLILGLIFRL